MKMSTPKMRLPDHVIKPKAWHQPFLPTSIETTATSRTKMAIVDLARCSKNVQLCLSTNREQQLITWVGLRPQCCPDHCIGATT